MPEDAKITQNDLNRPKPNSPSDLFWSFTKIALQGFGGVLAIIQRELVDKKKWLTLDEFVEDWAVAQILPGPNVVNLSLMLGDRYFGTRGALAALAGMLTFPLLVILVIAVVFSGISESHLALGALKGMGAVAAGLIAAVGLKLIKALKSNVMGVGVCIAIAAITFVAIGILRIPLIWVLLSLGVLSTLWAYRQFGVVDSLKTKALA